MATQPTFVSEYETAWNTTTSPKSVSSVSVQPGDLILICGGAADNGSTLSTPTGGGLTYSLVKNSTSPSYCNMYVWSATAASADSLTIESTMSGGANNWGFNVLVFRKSLRVGATANAMGSGSAPTISSMTGLGVQSIFVVFSGDWSAADGTSRTWLATYGSANEVTYDRTVGSYTMYGAYYTSVSDTNPKNFGITLPASQTYNIVAVEIMANNSTAGAKINRGLRPHSFSPGLAR